MNIRTLCLSVCCEPVHSRSKENRPLAWVGSWERRLSENIWLWKEVNSELPNALQYHYEILKLALKACLLRDSMNCYSIEEITKTEYIRWSRWRERNVGAANAPSVWLSTTPLFASMASHGPPLFPYEEFFDLACIWGDSWKSGSQPLLPGGHAAAKYSSFTQNCISQLCCISQPCCISQSCCISSALLRAWTIGLQQSLLQLYQELTVARHQPGRGGGGRCGGVTVSVCQCKQGQEEAGQEGADRQDH